MGGDDGTRFSLKAEDKGDGFFFRKGYFPTQSEIDQVRAWMSSYVDKLVGPNRVETTLHYSEDIPGYFGTRGLFRPRPNKPATIDIALRGRDPIQVASHEALHAIRRLGLLTDQEWKALTNASREFGWANKYDVHRRYSQSVLDINDPLAKSDYLTEEAIADALGDYAGTRAEVPSEIRAIFDKMLEFLKNTVEYVGQLFKVRQDPSMDPVYLATKAEEHQEVVSGIFDQILSGEVGQRTEGPIPSSFNPRFSEGPVQGFRLTKQGNFDLEQIVSARADNLYRQLVNEAKSLGEVEHVKGLSRKMLPSISKLFTKETLDDGTSLEDFLADDMESLRKGSSTITLGTWPSSLSLATYLHWMICYLRLKTNSSKRKEQQAVLGRNGRYKARCVVL